MRSEELEKLLKDEPLGRASNGGVLLDHAPLLLAALRLAEKVDPLEWCDLRAIWLCIYCGADTEAAPPHKVGCVWDAFRAVSK